jgi:hypothetical protein
MPINLPEPIAAYFAADARDAAAVADCFSLGATVRDEKRTHTGRGAIQAWKAEASSKYSYTAEPIEVGENGGKTAVICRVSGNFPGSPIELRYAFATDGDLISSLEITG